MLWQAEIQGKKGLYQASVFQLKGDPSQNEAAFRITRDATLIYMRKVPLNDPDGWLGMFERQVSRAESPNPDDWWHQEMEGGLAEKNRVIFKARLDPFSCPECKIKLDRIEAGVPKSLWMCEKCGGRTLI